MDIWNKFSNLKINNLQNFFDMIFDYKLNNKNMTSEEFHFSTRCLINYLINSCLINILCTPC